MQEIIVFIIVCIAFALAGRWIYHQISRLKSHQQSCIGCPSSHQCAIFNPEKNGEMKKIKPKYKKNNAEICKSKNI